MPKITSDQFQQQMKRLDGLQRPIHDEEAVGVLYHFFKHQPLEILETTISLYKMEARIYPVPGDLIRIARELGIERCRKKVSELSTTTTSMDSIPELTMPKLSEDEWARVQDRVTQRVHPFHKTRKAYEEVCAKPIQNWGEGEVTATEVYMRVLRDQVVLDMQQEGILTHQERRA